MISDAWLFDFRESFICASPVGGHYAHYAHARALIMPCVPWAHYSGTVGVAAAAANHQIVISHATYVEQQHQQQTARPRECMGEKRCSRLA
jgi:hypothetical protein